MWALLGESVDISRFLPLMTLTGYPLVVIDESGGISWRTCSETGTEERSWTFPLRIQRKGEADSVVRIGIDEARVAVDAECVFLNPERELLCRV
jgi:hypothetical protein